MVQQHAGPDKQENVARGLRAFEAAARAGAQVIGFAELAFDPFHIGAIYDVKDTGGALAPIVP